MASDWDPAALGNATSGELCTHVTTHGDKKGVPKGIDSFTQIAKTRFNHRHYEQTWLLLPCVHMSNWMWPCSVHDNLLRGLILGELSR